MISRWYETILAGVLIMVLPSSVSKVAVRPGTQDALKDRICSVREGMTKSQVVAAVGDPDEIRLKGQTGILEEAYRWVYGVSSKGEFPRGGAVIFRTNHTVLMSYCPARPFPWVPAVTFSEAPQTSPSGMRCTIEKVFKNPDFYNYYYIPVSIQNTGTNEFRFTNDHTGIRFSLILEVYDAKKALVLREPLSAHHSGVSPFKTDWPVLRIHPGARESEDVPVWWRDENDGVLPPGTYYLRVAFPFEEGKFFGSNLARWELPRGLDEGH
jgi:hypothetical protein